MHFYSPTSHLPSAGTL